MSAPFPWEQAGEAALLIVAWLVLALIALAVIRHEIRLWLAACAEYERQARGGDE